MAKSRDTMCAAGEVALLERVRARDVKAFEVLYRAYHGRLSHFLQKFLRRPCLVEEVLNDTMLVVWSRIDSFNGNSRFSTWMYGIAYRQGLSALRRVDEPVEGHEADLVDTVECGPEYAAGRERSRQTLTAALAQLSPTHRAVVELTYYQEFGYSEIADIMSCPVDTVKTRMFHARRHLRRLLSGQLYDWI